MNVAVLVLSFAYFFVFIFQCSPMETFWTIKPNNENCMNPDAIVGIAYAAAALGSISDWIFGTHDGVEILRLLMLSRRPARFRCLGPANEHEDKGGCGLYPGFCSHWQHRNLGSHALHQGLRGTERLSLYASRSNGITPVLTKSPLDESTDIAIWSTIEPGIGMTAACIATLRPLLQHVLHRTGLSTPRATTGRSASNWSTGNALGSSKNRTGYLRSQDDGHTLGNLRPDYTATATIVTGPGTVKKGGGGGWRSNGSDESDKGSDDHVVITGAGDIHVSKSVQITRVAEAEMDLETGNPHDFPLRPSMSLNRSDEETTTHGGSAGGERGGGGGFGASHSQYHNGGRDKKHGRKSSRLQTSSSDESLV